MVRSLFLLFFLLPMCAFAQRGVDVIVEVNSAVVGENQPIDVDIKILRDESLKVKEDSFHLDGQPLKAHLLQSGRQSSVTIINGKREEENLVIATYRATVPGKPKGLYILPSISVEVGGKRYSSKAVSYEILASQEDQGFRLAAFVEGVTPLYPGQHAKFVYRIYFKDNIEVTYEDLPLMEAEGFRAVGEKQFRRFNRGDQQVTEVTQEVEALEPGQYTFGLSTIEGFAYRENFFGRKVYSKPRLRATAEPVTIAVEPFPSQGKPESFKGMIGDYKISARLLSSDQIIVGDKIELEVIFQGTGEPNSVQLPDLAFQPNIKGNFRLSDLPPVASQKSETEKSFVVELRPLTALVDQIPSIEVAQFNPISRSYETLRTQPIPLKVEAARRPSKFEEATPKPQVMEDFTQPPQVTTLQQSIVIEISGNYSLSSVDLHRPFYTRWTMLWMIPGGAILLWLQLVLKRRGPRREPKTTAKQLLSQGEFELSENGSGLQLISQSLLHRLYELGIVEQKPFSAEDIPSDGICGEVREFIRYLDECRFGGPNQYDAKDVVRQARDLFRRIK